MSGAKKEQSKNGTTHEWRQQMHRKHFTTLRGLMTDSKPVTKITLPKSLEVESTKLLDPSDLVVDKATSFSNEQPTVGNKLDSFNKNDQAKTDWSLLPVEAIEEVLKVLEFGAKRYGKFNWIENSESVEWSRFVNALERHLASFKKGQDTDADSGLLELAHIATNALFLLTFKIQNLGIDNRDFRLGKVINKLTCISFIKKENGHRFYNFECGHCGAIFSSSYNNVQRGNTKSCGCQHHTNNTNKTHGMSETPIYNRWRGILLRCNDDTAISYPNYGGRGIKVCDKWSSFEGFFEDMGNPPEGDYQLDRIDNDGDYTKENCQWITRQENLRKTKRVKKFMVDGIEQTIAELSHKYNINQKCLSKRIRMGWDVLEAVRTPSNKPELDDRFK
jgi:hypothetical protein